MALKMTSEMNAPKMISTIQVDLDGLWTNLQYYGYESDVSPDAVFETAIPRYIELFREFGIKATFFVIGKDVEDPKKKALLQRLHQEGHELANHTYTHPFGLRKLTKEQKLQEIEKGEKAIISITGKKPLGFKSPGYDVDPETQQILREKGYIYDSSVIPTFVYPIIMRINSVLTRSTKRTHGPKLHWFLAPNRPYYPSLLSEWKKGKFFSSKSSLLEIPCTTMPFFKIPIHATFALKFGMLYFLPTYFATRIIRLPINYELHAADLADVISDSRLGHLVGMSLERRISLCRKMLKIMTEHHDFVTSIELAKTFNARIKDK